MQMLSRLLLKLEWSEIRRSAQAPLNIHRSTNICDESKDGEESITIYPKLMS